MTRRSAQTLGRMRHAGPVALSALHAVLEHLRQINGLTERKPGIFYRGSSAFLHFHEDDAGLFADAKVNGRTFERMPVNTKLEQVALLSKVSSALQRK